MGRRVPENSEPHQPPDQSALTWATKDETESVSAAARRERRITGLPKLTACFNDIRFLLLVEAGHGERP
jgi:hypothetical protein